MTQTRMITHCPKWARYGQKRTVSEVARRRDRRLRSPRRHGHHPARGSRQIKNTASFSVDRINEIERTTRHDVIAFTTALAENIGPESRLRSLRSDVV